MWHNDMLESERKKQERYWMSQYEGELPVLELPTDFTRAREMEIDGRTVDFEATERQTDGMDRLAAMNNTTRYAVLLSIFSLFLAKEARHKDIVVGTPIIGKPYREFERIIGMFVNTLAIRNRPRASLTVGD
jgi:hypothetical protein